jgi:hypothetical protein
LAQNGSFFESLKGKLDLTDGNFEDYLTQNAIFCFWIAQNVEARDGISKLFNEKFGKSFISGDFFSRQTVQAIEKHPRDFERSHPMEIENYLDFVEEQNGLEFLKNYFVGIDRPTFEYASYFINILEWFEGKLEDDRNFLKNFALKTDENANVDGKKIKLGFVERMSRIYAQKAKFK